MAKVQIKGWISKETNDEFRKVIAQKYGSYKRCQLSKVLELSIRNQIRIENTKQQNTKNVQNPISKVVQNWQKVVTYLIDNKIFLEIDRVPQYQRRF